MKEDHHPNLGPPRTQFTLCLVLILFNIFLVLLLNQFIMDFPEIQNYIIIITFKIHIHIGL